MRTLLLVHMLAADSPEKLFKVAAVALGCEHYTELAGHTTSEIPPPDLNWWKTYYSICSAYIPLLPDTNRDMCRRWYPKLEYVYDAADRIRSILVANVNAARKKLVS